MTTDEELAQLEDTLRRLKVEYDMFFGGGSKKPPTDLEWRTQSLIKKYADSQRLTSQQRFRYNGMVQRYAVYSDLWRQKLRIREEGYRRPQDAMLGIHGLRSTSLEEKPNTAKRSVVLTFSQSDESEHIRELYEAVQRASTTSSGSASLETFSSFLRAKTRGIQEQYGCSAVKYTIEVKDGRVRIKARPKP